MTKALNGRYAGIGGLAPLSAPPAPKTRMDGNAGCVVWSVYRKVCGLIFLVESTTNTYLYLLVLQTRQARKEAAATSRPTTPSAAQQYGMFSIPFPQRPTNGSTRRPYLSTVLLSWNRRQIRLGSVMITVLILIVMASGGILSGDMPIS